MTTDTRRQVRLGINPRRITAPLAMLLVVAVSACSTSPTASSSPSADLDIVATTTVLADIVSNVAGDRAAVRSILPSGVGPEDYEPKPADAKTLDGTDLVVSNGIGLDDFLDGLIESGSGGDAPRLVLGDGIPTIDVDGEPNPHFWLDPTIVADQYLPAIEAELVEIDPAGAATYRANADAYATQVRAMDSELATAVSTIPASDRKLVTFHDAFPYFARHYGFELVGVVLGSPGQEPSAGDLAALVETVKAADVRAVFSEAQFNPALAETLAQEAGITTVVSTLYTDALGAPPADTYLGMMRWNMAQIVEALRSAP
jgi:zinc/manganese transport system substrate-binding protein/manganese/iron transport system substrate-binding protein